MSHDDKIKEYFQDEINMVKTPSFPRERKITQTNWKDILATAACIVLVVAVLLNPASQKSQVRSINLSAQRFDEITSRISQVFIDASPYMY
jgi:hypothetical protein